MPINRSTSPIQTDPPNKSAQSDKYANIRCVGSDPKDGKSYLNDK